MTTVTSPTPTTGIPPHPVSNIHAASEPKKADLPNTTAPKAATPRATSAIETALRAILSEVTPGYRPFFSSDSYLPAHLVDAARAALKETVSTLQTSALDLVHRMIAAHPGDETKMRSAS